VGDINIIFANLALTKDEWPYYLTFSSPGYTSSDHGVPVDWRPNVMRLDRPYTEPLPFCHYFLPLKLVEQHPKFTSALTEILARRAIVTD
jgi:hypothetical protein